MTRADFDSKNNCEKLALLSQVIKKKLYLFVKSEIGLDELITTAQIILQGHSNNEFQDPDMDCSACYDFEYYAKLLFDTIDNVDLDNLKQKLQIWEKTIAEDLILNSLEGHPNKFNITGTPENLKEISYFDFNIYQHIEDRNLFSLINSKDIDIFYSPIHLEEVYRMQNPYYQNIRIDTISKITHDKVLLRMDNKISIYIEKPINSYIRVLNNIPLSVAFEEKKLIKNDDREIFFKDIQNEQLKHTTDDENIFEIIDENILKSLLQFSGCYLQIDDFKKENKTTGEILHMIYSLYDVLDNIAFQSDKKKNEGRTIRSAVYDIEHLIFSTYCNELITADKKMAKRAIQIFKMMNINTKVIFIDKNYTLEAFLNDKDNLTP
jgi:hypothetical protein